MADDTPSPAFRALAAHSRGRLETILVAGERPDAAALAGREYRGLNHARATSLLRIRKFVKGFFTVGDDLFGFNTPVVQDGLDAPWRARPDDAHPRRFAFFAVSPAPRGRPDGRYPNALLLDYGAGVSHAVDPARRLRDYIVRVESGSDALLLGKAYLAVGARRMPVGYFLLERRRAFEPGPDLARHVRVPLRFDVGSSPGLATQARPYDRGRPALHGPPVAGREPPLP